MTLDPAVDLWVITEENTTFSTWSFTIGSGDRSRSATATVVELASEVETNIANPRQTVVDFDISGLDSVSLWSPSLLMARTSATMARWQR